MKQAELNEILRLHKLLNDWEVEWEVLPDYNADGDEGDACDWENPVYAHNNNESFYD